MLVVTITLRWGSLPPPPDRPLDQEPAILAGQPSERAEHVRAPAAYADDGETDLYRPDADPASRLTPR